MAEITITSAGSREFDVQLRDGESETTHYVTVPEEPIGEFEPPEADLEGLVRQSFAFLLEREPASSIMSEFSLGVISEYFPEYPEEMSQRFS